MRNYLVLKNDISLAQEYILIILTTIIFTLIPFNKSFAEQNVFTIDNIKLKGKVDLNFSRDKYINQAFNLSFERLMQKILLTRDLEKVKNTKLKKIKRLVKNFQILEESYKKDEYVATFKIFYNEKKIKNFLGDMNISFSTPENISAVFFPILYINGEIQDFDNNFFYKNWLEVKIENEIINFFLPVLDLDDISKISKMKDSIENLNIDSLVNKYDVDNYVFTLMNYQKRKLNIYIKIKFNNNIITKNISEDLINIDDELALNFILKKLKLTVTDLWKEENLINVLLPLSIDLKFKHSNIRELDSLRNTLKKISIIDDFSLKKFDVNSSLFKIYYYGDPKKLRSELIKFGYLLNHDQGFWQIYLNE